VTFVNVVGCIIVLFFRNLTSQHHVIIWPFEYALSSEISDFRSGVVEAFILLGC